MNFPGPINANLSAASALSLDSEHLTLIPRSHSEAGGQQAGVVIVPDAQLLFSGDYSRAGNDLVLSAQNQKYVVHDYFKGEKRPTLSTKDGATLTGDVISALTGHVQYAQAAAPAAAEIIGHVMKMTGSASVVRNGVSIVLNVGDAVQKGDVVQTGTNSSIGLTLIDGTAFGMASNARMVLNEMVYDPSGSSNSSLISLVQGTITFVAGQTAKNGNMRVDTPVATMGIRGTAVLVEISADNGPTKFSVLLEPDGHTGSFNIYDKTTGQLIGTVTQAGQVTFVSPAGIGQVTASEQSKTAFDLQAEKSIIQDVFKLYFPNYNPDANPKSTDNPRTDIGVPQNTLTKTGFNEAGRPIVITTTTFVNPDTQTTTTLQTTYINTAPTFSVQNVLDVQAPPLNPTPGPHSFYLGDKVTITDPDIGAAPFLDIAVPYLAGTGNVTALTSITSVSFGAYLLDPLRIELDTNTGLVTYDPEAFRFLDVGQIAIYTFTFTAASGVGSTQSDQAGLTLTLTVTGANDAPTIEGILGFTGGVKEDTDSNGDPISTTISTDGVITFKDFDLTDSHIAAISSTVPTFYIGNFSIVQPSEDIHDTGDTGTVNWHFEIQNESSNTKLQSLAEGETLTQQYTITITDSHGVSVDQVVAITITGTNDAPLLNADVVSAIPVLHHATELTDSTGVTTADTATGTLSFNDVDLTDTHVASAILDTDPDTSIVWSGHTSIDLPPGLRAALEAAVTASIAAADDSTNTGAGTVHWDFSANDDLFDFLGETETLTLTYNVKVEDFYNDASGAHPAGTSSTQTITIVVGAANDRPVILNTSTLTGTTPETDGVTGAVTVLTVTGIINYSDADVIDTDSIMQATGAAVWTDVDGITHNITDAAIVASSQLVFGAVDQAANTAGWTYTVADNALDFLAVGETLVVKYDITVTDNSGATNDTSTTKQIVVTFTGANDAPDISVTSPASVIEGNTGDTAPPVAITIADTVTITDVDTSDVHVPYVVNTLAYDAAHSTGPAPAVGTLPGLFTIDAILGTVTYDKADFDYLAAGESVNAVFIFDVASGLDVQNKFITITINGENDAPMLSSSTAPDGTEDIAGPFFKISDLFTGKFSDIDGGGYLKGIAIANADTDGHGTWWFSDNNGGNSSPLPALTAATAIILASDVSLRFVPAQDYNGPIPALTVYAIDDTYSGYFTSGSGGPVYTVDLTQAYTHGDTASVALNSTTISGGTVTAVNDAPTATSLSATLAAIDEDTTNPSGATVSSLFAANFSDAADAVPGGSTADTFAGIAISGYSPDSAKGDWQYADSLAGPWTTIGSAGYATAILLFDTDLLRFVPAPDYNGAATPLSANLVESGGSITSGAVVDLTGTGAIGGSSHYSFYQVALGETIDPVNDAPVISASGLTVTQTTGPDTTTFSALTFSDPDDGDMFTVTATAAHGDVTDTSGGVLPSGQLNFGDLNTLLTDGIKYAPTTNVGTDTLTLSISDGHIADTVNFIFNIDPAPSAVTLNATAGNDYLFGTTNSDTFVFGASFGHDTIKDFTFGGQDIIQFSASSFTSLADIIAHTADVAGHAVITTGIGDSVALLGVTTAQLNQNDFHLV